MKETVKIQALKINDLSDRFLEGTKQSPAHEQEIASSKTPVAMTAVSCSKGWHEGPCATRNGVYALRFKH